MRVKSSIWRISYYFLCSFKKRLRGGFQGLLTFAIDDDSDSIYPGLYRLAHPL